VEPDWKLLVGELAGLLYSIPALLGSSHGDGEGEDDGDRFISLFGFNGTFGLSFNIGGFLVIIGFGVPFRMAVLAYGPTT
jgi:hypothetical protein